MSQELPPRPSAPGRDYAREWDRTIPGLDVIRAVAVSLVIFFHFGIPHVPGAYGVMMFFVLSGFLITWLLLREHERDGTISIRGFFERRVLRIFPAFYAFWFGVVALLLLTRRPIDWPQAWSAFAYVTNYYNGLHGSPSGPFSHTWSLAIEEQFYLGWPLLFLWWQRRPERLLRRLVLLIAATWIYRAVLALVLEADPSYIYSAFDTRFDALMIGCAMAVAVRRRVGTRFWSAVTRNAALPLPTIALLCLSIFVGPMLAARYRDAVGYGVEAALTAVLIFQLAALSTTSGAWAWLNNRALQYVGRLSYSLYLYQQVTLYAVRSRMEGFPVIVQLAAALLVTMACAAGSYYVIERPFLKLKDARARRSRAASPSSVEPEAAPTRASA